MMLRETFESLALLLIVAGITAAGFVVAFTRSSATQALDEQLHQARIMRDSAQSREARVRDSAQQVIAQQDAAWSLHVRDLVGLHQQELQEVTRATARRARRQVEARVGAPLPEVVDSASPCHVSLTCIEAAAWQASDSLLRFQVDSARAQAGVAAAECSTRVASTMVARDSAHVLQQHPRFGTPFYVALGLAVAELLIIVTRTVP